MVAQITMGSKLIYWFSDDDENNKKVLCKYEPAIKTAHPCKYNDAHLVYITAEGVTPPPPIGEQKKLCRTRLWIVALVLKCSWWDLMSFWGRSKNAARLVHDCFSVGGTQGGDKVWGPSICLKNSLSHMSSRRLRWNLITTEVKHVSHAWAFGLCSEGMCCLKKTNNIVYHMERYTQYLSIGSVSGE